MDLRHGCFCKTWRRSSPAPPSVRTCTPASAVIHVQRRLKPRRRAVKQCSSASCAVAIDNTYEPSAASAEPARFELPGSKGFYSPDAACPAVLQTRLSKAHSSAASAALVVQDSPDEKLVATASLDKGMAIWRFYVAQGEGESMDDSCDESIEVTRLKVPGAPVFSLAKIPEVLPDGTIVRKRPKPPGIYLGTSSKEVLTWMLGSKDVTDKVVLDGHTGWVRSLAVTGKWLFSCGCNYLRLWDTTFRTPKECDSARLFTGDILAIAASDGRVFTAGADGSLHSWAIRRAGDLQEGPSRDKAHDGRVSACVVSGGRVFTVSYDGSIKAWTADSLELIAEVRGAHNGDKIFCAAVGANCVLFTGGDDKLVRAWDQDLNPVGVPLEGHGASVRVLSAGRRALLVSGDADGDVCIWETYPVDLPSSSAAAASAANALGAQEALLPGVGLEALGDIATAAGAVGARAGEATVQQLETLLAGPQQHEVGEQPAAAVGEEAVGTAYDFFAGQAASAGWQAALEASKEQQRQQQGATADAAEQVASILTAEQQQQEAYHAPAVDQPQELKQGAVNVHDEQEHQHGPVGLEMARCVQCEDLTGAGFLGLAEWQQRGDAAPPDSAAAVLGSEVCGTEQQLLPGEGCGEGSVGPSHVELIVDGPVEGPHGGAGYDGCAAAGDAADVGLTVAAAAVPAVNANGSGGFAVMAATVSGDAAEYAHSAMVMLEVDATGAGDEQEEQEHHFRQIEVESVASAVAAACLAKDADGWATAGVGVGGRSHQRQGGLSEGR